MAELEVEAARRAEFERVGEAKFRDRLNGGLAEEPKRHKSFGWWGDEAEARRLQDEHTYHYSLDLRRRLAAVIVSLVVFGLTLLH